MDVEKQVAYWRTGSDEDWDSARWLVEQDRQRHWALFIMHLSLEKALKALYAARRAQVPPKTHNLNLIAEETGAEFTKDQQALMYEVREFNLEARYPETQRQLREIATTEFTQAYFNRLQELHRWVLQQI